MTIYLINYILLPFYGLLKQKTIAVFFLGLQLFFLLALRSEHLGVDVAIYQALFERISFFSFHEALSVLNPFGNAQFASSCESGYFLFNWIVGYLGLSFHTFLVIIAAICVYSLSFFVYRYSRLPWLSFAIVIAIGMYGIMFCILRQSLATAILYFSIPLINQRKLVKFVIVVFIAAQFHVIALSFLPLYWLSRITINSVNFFKFLSLSALLGLLIPLLNRYVFSAFFGYYGKTYALDDTFVYNNMFLFMLAIVVYIFFFYICNNNEIERTDSTLFWGMTMCVPIQILAFSVTIFSRASIGIFFPFSAVLIANSITTKKNDQVYFFSILYFICFFLFYVMFDLFNNSLDIVPYLFYFE